MDPCPSPSNPEQFADGLVALYPRLLQIAMNLCRNKANAYDLVQDTIEKGLRCRAQFRMGEAPDRWLSTILRRTFVDGYRRERSRALQISNPSLADAVSSPEPPSVPVWEAFTIDDIRRAISLLDPNYRDVLTMFTFDKIPQRDISRRLSISSSTVATRILRGRRKLRQVLESDRSRRLGGHPKAASCGHLKTGQSEG